MLSINNNPMIYDQKKIKQKKTNRIDSNFFSGAIAETRAELTDDPEKNGDLLIITLVYCLAVS